MTMTNAFCGFEVKMVHRNNTCTSFVICRRRGIDIDEFIRNGVQAIQDKRMSSTISSTNERGRMISYTYTFKCGGSNLPLRS